MNEDKWQRTMINRRKARKKEQRLGCLIILFIIIIIFGGGSFFYYRHTHSPEYALNQLETAFAHRDIDTIHQYIDFKTLLPPNYKILTNDIFTNDKIYSQKEHTIYKTFYNLIEPILVEGTIQSIDKYILTGNWQRFNYNSLLKGRQLGIDYTELINRSLLFNIDFKEIKSVDKLNETSAIAIISVVDNYTKTPFDLKINLTKNDDNTWKVTGIENYHEYLNLISNLYHTDITSYLNNTKEALAKNNTQFKALQNEFIILAVPLKNNPSLNQRAIVKSFIENKIIPSYQNWYDYLQSSQIPLGARHLHELRMESASYSIQAWKKYATGIYEDNITDLTQAERLHEKTMETEQKITDTINNMPALFMPSID